MKRVVLSLIFLLIFRPLNSQQGPDPFDLISYDIEESAKNMKKLAVLPYFYKDEQKPTEEGLIIAERIASKLSLKFKLSKIEEIADAFEKINIKTSSQLKKEQSIKLGELLDVDGIVLGRLEKDEDGDIKTITWLVDSSSGNIKMKTQLILTKDLSSVKPIFTKDINKIIRKMNKNFGYFEYFFGFGSVKTDIESDPSSFLPLPSYLAKNVDNLKTTAFGPVGIRVGGFNGAVGFNGDFFIYRYKTESQNVYINSQNVKVPSSYIDLTGFGIGGDLLFRTTTKIQFYSGLGLAFSINKISSDYITNVNNSKKIDELSLGLIWRIPLGLRYIKESKSYFFEWRYQQNYTDFSRNSSQTNKINQKLSLFIFGFGNAF